MLIATGLAVIGRPAEQQPASVRLILQLCKARACGVNVGRM